MNPPADYRAEHGFITTSTLYCRMCHILHTCTLNSSSLSACDTPVGLALNAAAWMNQGAAYFVSFDPRSPSLAWSHSLNWRATAATTFFSSDSRRKNLLLQTYGCKHCWNRAPGWRGLEGQFNSNLVAREIFFLQLNSFKRKINWKWLEISKPEWIHIEVMRNGKSNLFISAVISHQTLS